MTWFFKTAVFWVTVILLGYTLEIFGYTVWQCKRDCKDEPDDHLCCMMMFDLDNGGEAPHYKWLRNECERKCFMWGEYQRVNMSECTKDGQNYTTYMCNDARVHPVRYEKCMRKESMKNQSNH